MKNNRNLSIGIIGLGYVGLPLALEFGKKVQTFGYDRDKKRINEIKKNYDNNNEFKKIDFFKSKYLTFSSNIETLSKCNFYIIAVPTPITKKKKPDLRILKSATRETAKIIKKNDIIVYESTVYPGVTQEVCIPIIENISGLKSNQDFTYGYSPERVNPGDKERTLTKITKLISGSDKKTSKKIKKVYEQIIDTTYEVSNIKVAEAAKVIENIQRDVNIALINELSEVFSKLKIDTKEVIDAAKTKWNFHPYEPGLVGGHCIGVDPYYLAYKSQKLKYKTKIILAGRTINENVSSRVVKQISDLCKKKKMNLSQARVLILGLTFKENCSDLRNSKVIDIVYKLLKKNAKVEVYDPYIKDTSFKINKAVLVKNIKKTYYDIIILAVKHNEFKKLTSKDILSFTKKRSVIFDIKGILDQSIIDARL